jgi:hypothetical protein
MKPTRKVKKLETPWACAVRLAAHFGVAPQTATQWFDAGCPNTFDEAVAWKESRNEENKIRSVNSAGRSKIERAQAEAKETSADIDWSKLSTDMVNLCEIVCDLYLAGLTTNTIEERLGTKQSVVTRIITNHPRTKDKDKEVSADKWKTIRRLAQDSVIDTFQDPEALRKLRPSDRILAAGIAHDKVKDSEGPAQIAINIKAKIEAMSYEELINSIPKMPTIEGEFTAVETSPMPQTPSAKPASLPLPDTSESQEEDTDNETVDDE